MVRFDDRDVWSRDTISPGVISASQTFCTSPASRLFARWSVDSRVHLDFSQCTLPLLLYLWAELCLRGASFETGTVRHSADTYLVQRTLHYAGRAHSAASGSLGCWVSVVDMKAKPAKETTPLAVAGRCKPMKVEKPRKPREHKVKQGTPPKLSASQKRKLVRLYLYTDLGWKDISKLVVYFGQKAIQ